MARANASLTPRYLRRGLLCVALAIAGVSVAVFQCPGLGTPELYESHVSPGGPTIEIRWAGFMGGSLFDAYLVRGPKREKILTSLENIPEHFDETTNRKPRTYARCIVTRDRLPIYQVAWSADSNRVAIAFHGYFVAAYDCVTRQKIEFKDYADTGLASEFDYKLCDSEIGRFLQRPAASWPSDAPAVMRAVFKNIESRIPELELGAVSQRENVMTGCYNSTKAPPTTAMILMATIQSYDSENGARRALDANPVFKEPGLDKTDSLNGLTLYKCPDRTLLCQVGVYVVGVTPVGKLGPPFARKTMESFVQDLAAASKK